MNELLQLKGRFEQRPSNNRPSKPKLLSDRIVTSSELLTLRQQLNSLRKYWQTVTYFEGALITIVYKDIVPKSRRAKEIFKKNSRIYPNDLIVGVRYFEEQKKRHAITYYVDEHTINKTLEKIDLAIEILNNEFAGEITTKIVDYINDKLIPINCGC